MEVQEHLRAAADIFEERSKVYGDSYLKFGEVLKAFFPDGLILTSEEDFGRFALFVQMAGKQRRYAENFRRGGHEDSLDDLSVYSMMLRKLDSDAKDPK